MTYAKWRRRLANANDERFIPITWIDEALDSGRAQFWATDEAAIVTEVTVFPGGAKAVRAIAAAGRKADLTGPLAEAIEAWAREQGCSHAMIEGREGWRGLFPDYRFYQAIIVKDL